MLPYLLGNRQSINQTNKQTNANNCNKQIFATNNQRKLFTQKHLTSYGPYHILTSVEAKLCENLKVSPTNYIGARQIYLVLIKTMDYTSKPAKFALVLLPVE